MCGKLMQAGKAGKMVLGAIMIAFAAIILFVAGKVYRILAGGTLAHLADQTENALLIRLSEQLSKGLP